MNEELRPVTIADPAPVMERIPVAQGLLFQRLRLRLLRNAGSLLMDNSRVRLVTVVLCSLLVWGSVYGASWFGFEMLRQQRIGFGGGIVGILFDFLFLALAVMLIFSSGIILFGGLFSAPETRFLLTLPAAADQVFAFKFQTALGFSSWGFVLLGSPILIAYGVVFKVPWYFYAMLLPFFFGFILVPGSVGAIVCLLIVNFAPQRRAQVLGLIGAVLAAAIVFWAYRVLILARGGLANRDALQTLLGQFTFAQGALVPSHWMTKGLQSAARGDLIAMLYPLALIWANGLFLYVLAAFTARKLYRRGYNRLSEIGSTRKKIRISSLDRIAELMVCYLDRQTRLLIIKDFRTFRRDPVQWGQLLIFVGLVLLYGLNSRQFYYQKDINRAYQNGISFMNLLGAAILMCAYMGRFIYPLLSLEGRKFWVLGLLPMPRERLLWGKFVFAATGSLIVAEGLVLVSDILLAMPASVMALHALTIAVLALGLSGLSVGLGAWIPNFHESDPSKIAVGFGGTLNLIVGLLFLVCTVGLMAGPYHLTNALSADHLVTLRDQPILMAGVPIGMVLGVLAVWLPLSVGARSLRRMEF